VVNKFNIADDGQVQTYLCRYLDTIGDGSGTKNANGDFSVTPKTFFIQPPATQIFRISRLLINIRDTGSLDTGNYGNNITLTNGIQIKLVDDFSTLLDLTDGLPIFTNIDWNKYCFNLDISTFGAGDQYLNLRWSFFRGQTILRLKGANNERLEAQLNDNFTSLVQHFFLVQGTIE